MKLKNRKAFTLAEMMVVMLILSIVIISASPVVVKRIQKKETKAEHGAYQCWEEGGKFHEVYMDENGTPIPGKIKERSTTAGCQFAPPKDTMFFLVNAVGAGSGGYGTEKQYEKHIQTQITKANGHKLNDNTFDYFDDEKIDNSYVFGLNTKDNAGNSVSIDYKKLYDNGDWKDAYDFLQKQEKDGKGIPVMLWVTSKGGALRPQGSYLQRVSHSKLICEQTYTPENCAKCNTAEASDYKFCEDFEGVHMNATECEKTLAKCATCDDSSGRDETACFDYTYVPANDGSSGTMAGFETYLKQGDKFVKKERHIEQIPFWESGHKKYPTTSVVNYKNYGAGIGVVNSSNKQQKGIFVTDGKWGGYCYENGSDLYTPRVGRQTDISRTLYINGEKVDESKWSKGQWEYSVGFCKGYEGVGEVIDFKITSNDEDNAYCGSLNGTERTGSKAKTLHKATTYKPVVCASYNSVNTTFTKPSTIKKFTGRINNFDRGMVRKETMQTISSPSSLYSVQLSTCNPDSTNPFGYSNCTFGFNNVTPQKNFGKYGDTTFETNILTDGQWRTNTMGFWGVHNIIGNMVNVFKEKLNGFNFYGKSGSPGEYKTLYVTRFRHPLVIFPGIGGDVTKDGGDTQIYYNVNGTKESTPFFTAAGGKMTKLIDENMFVVGKRFEVPLKSSAIDPITIKNGKDTTDYDNFTRYFLPQSSNFVNVITGASQIYKLTTLGEYETAVANTAPGYVGDGGYGGFTIYRSYYNGKKITVNLVDNTSSTSNTRTVGHISKAYSCNDSTSINGTKIFCPATKGNGGAVIITW